jgi:hypothetical protein
MKQNAASKVRDGRDLDDLPREEILQGADPRCRYRHSVPFESHARDCSSHG